MSRQNVLINIGTVKEDEEWASLTGNDDDTFSQRVLTLVSGSCLQSMSCSIQPSNSLSWVFSDGSSVEGIFVVVNVEVDVDAKTEETN